mgnify:FL=1
MKISRIWIIAVLALAAFTAVSSPLCGQAGDAGGRDPLLGSWKVEIVFGPEPLDFTFSESGHYTVTEADGGVDRLSYTLEPSRNRMRMQMDEEASMVWKYSFSGNDEFNLYLTDEDNELMEMLLSGFEEAGDFNELTLELLSVIRGSVRETVLDFPVIRGIRTAD